MKLFLHSISIPVFQVANQLVHSIGGTDNVYMDICYTINESP